MNELLSPPPTPLSQPAQQPLIDWDYWQSRRPFFLEVCEDLPAYLLLPEINRLLQHIHDDQTRFLIDTLWHTGARVSEALALTKDSFHLSTDKDSLVILNTLKQKKRGRPKSGDREKTPKRAIPITDVHYVTVAQRFIVSNAFRKGERLFPITRQTVDNRLKKVQAELENKNITFPLTLHAHTFRHSFAINALLQRRDAKTIGAWLGHKSEKSTAIYLQIISVETHHLMHGMAF